MKNVFFSSILLVIFAISIAATPPIKSDLNTFGTAKFKWVETTHDFGKIKEGEPVDNKFVFENNGTAPLIISNVKPSCGCTVTDYTKEPVPPGKKGYVKATYNAARKGAFNKTVRVTANIEGGSELLTIKGEVVSDDELKTETE